VNARGRGAVFIDRDGTLIVDYHFIGRAEQVELLSDAAASVKKLNDAGWLVLLVTNQSGIARGYFTMADYEKVHARMVSLLAAGGAKLDGAYVCPHHPDFTGPCECRKPGTLLFRQGAEEHGVDMEKSWLIGDKLRDVTPATPLAARGGILVPNDETPLPDVELARKEHYVTRTLDEAVRRVIESAG
jgi:D-glycero-D-manno-heptose 1,7-bisphosphate phosphatase